MIYKFRAWDKYRGENGLMLENHTFNSIAKTGLHNLEHLEWMMFTGLHDKNGKELYSGDIVKVPDDYEEFGISAGKVYEVYFAYGGFRLKAKYGKGRGFWLEDNKTFEKIGTIYTDSHLLEGVG